MLMIGTNNTGFRHEQPEITVKGSARVVREIRTRLPHTTVLLLAVFPRGEKPDDGLRMLNEGVNARLAKLANGQSVRFLNINAGFLQPDGMLSKDIVPDSLHPNERGYRIRAEAMQPTLVRRARRDSGLLG